MLDKDVDLWPGPPYAYEVDLPVKRLSDGQIALVLQRDINCYKVLVDGSVGWIDVQDIVPM